LSEVLAIIPARGGSKSLPRKNLAPFMGAPLITWSVEAALRSVRVTRTIVTTDDQEIADVSAEAGAEIPFIRPAELAEDHVRDLPVFEHALGWLRVNEGYVPDLVVQLRPTSPLRPDGLIDEAVRLLEADPVAHSLRTLCLPSTTPYKMWRVDGDRMFTILDSGIPEQHDAPRQILPVVYGQTGLIDVIRTSTITERGSMSGTEIVPMVVDQILDADIDDQASLDWAVKRAEEYGIGRDRG